jgi:hypothetical protein
MLGWGGRANASFLQENELRRADAWHQRMVVAIVNICRNIVSLSGCILSNLYK